MSRRPGRGAWALLGLIVLGAAALRLRLLDVPLDRDEGEYGYFAQLLLQGVPPYAQAYNLKLPGIYGVYAAILAAFGQSPAAIHLGLLVVNAATTVLVLCLAAHLYNSTVAVSAAAVFAVLSLGPRLYGIAAYAEHFVLLPARSEEHTSELQSRLHLVCRLLLEKKKKKKTHTIFPNIYQSL